MPFLSQSLPVSVRSTIREKGLTDRGAEVLSMLLYYHFLLPGPVSLDALARRVDRTPRQLHLTLTRLAIQGFVNHSQQDEHVELTEEGFNLISQLELLALQT